MVAWTQQINKHDVALPKGITVAMNGKIPDSLLSPVFNGKGIRYGKLNKPAARSLQAMVAQSLIDGVPASEIGWTDTYRTYESQLNLWNTRYDHTNHGNGGRTCGGDHRFLKDGMATAACPGTSNHGKGNAVDKGDAPKWHAWLEAHAGEYGWEWELASEKWHIHYWPGDNIPKAVLDHEKIQTVKEDPEMTLVIIQCNPGRDEWPEIKQALFKTNGLRSGTEWVPSVGHAAALHDALKVAGNDADDIVYVSPNFLVELLSDEFYAWSGPTFGISKPTKVTHPNLNSPYLPAS